MATTLLSKPSFGIAAKSLHRELRDHRLRQPMAELKLRFLTEVHESLHLAFAAWRQEGGLSPAQQALVLPFEHVGEAYARFALDNRAPIGNRAHLFDWVREQLEEDSVWLRQGYRAVDNLGPHAVVGRKSCHRRTRGSAQGKCSYQSCSPSHARINQESKSNGARPDSCSGQRGNEAIPKYVQRAWQEGCGN